MDQPDLPVQLGLLDLKDFRESKVYKDIKVYLGQSDLLD
jgi:hypothetical protein